MRIGIDARMMGPENSGLGRYVEQLVKYLLQIDRGNEYVLFVRKLPPPPTLPLAGGAFARFVVADIPWYGWEEQMKLPGIIKKEKVDLMHFPHWNVPFFYNGPFVVTVHDLTMWHYPRQEASTRGPLAYWIKDFFSRVVVRHAVKKARHIIVTSEFTKQDAHRALGVPLGKMTTAYQAPFTDGSLAKSYKLKSISSKITKPYALYAGNAYPHKNLERLLAAWKIVEEKCSGKYQLALVGKDSFFYEKTRQMSNVKCQMSNVIFTGFVSDEELGALYADARAFVFPSLYEGFGLPPLEAMARGVPVASSSASCLPEVLGEAALYFDPENAGAMADAIIRILSDEGLRAELSARGREEVRRYSWEALARRTLAVYNRSIFLRA